MVDEDKQKMAVIKLLLKDIRRALTEDERSKEDVLNLLETFLTEEDLTITAKFLETWQGITGD
jgi:hypothetical protein